MLDVNLHSYLDNCITCFDPLQTKSIQSVGLERHIIIRQFLIPSLDDRDYLPLFCPTC